TYLPGWLRDARELIHDRFAETITLAEIARALDVHPVHLARMFRKHFQCPMGEYQRRLRVEYASCQLMNTKVPLAEIAQSAGFSDQSHFSNTFRKQTGMTPRKFRSTFSLRES